MASYFLRSKHISRGKGARVTRAAAYRAGERIRDERTSEVYDYSDRNDVACKEVVVPSDLAGRDDMSWTQDRATLWNAAEHAGARRNSRLAREFLVLLPPELNPAQRVSLVRGFSQELADKYRCAVDMTVHTPRPGADARNHHAHLLMTVREVTPDGMGPRTALELGGRERHARGLGPTRAEYLDLRARWAQLTNRALQQAGLAARVDHRSYARQGVNREPTPTTPEKVFYAERQGGPGSAAGDAIRARHRERLEARRNGPGELERVIDRQKQELRERALQDLERTRSEPKRTRWASLTREERNALRREQYRRRREIEKTDPEGEDRRREVSRRRYHESFRRNPELIRERRREYRKAHAGEVNRNQREYRKACAEELNRRRRELRRAKAPQEGRNQQEDRPSRAQRPAAQASSSAPSATPQETARAWLSEQAGNGPQKTADRSATDWKAYRERGSSYPNPEDAARNWLASRDGRAGRDAAKSPAVESSQHGPEDVDDDALQRKRRREYDLGK